MSTNDGNNTNESSYSREDQEEQVLWDFRNIFQQVHGQLLDRPNALPEEELSYLESLYTDPTLHCVGAGLATFGMLKGMRGLWRILRRSRSGAANTYQMEHPPHSLPAQPPPTTGIRRFLTIANIVDFSLGSFAGIVTGAYWIDMHEKEGQLDQLPLQQGSSELCNYFCPPLMEEYNRQWDMATQNTDSTWQSNNQTLVNLGILKVQLQDEALMSPRQHQDILQNPNNPNLHAYLQFAQNCQRRKALQDRLRQKMGLPDNYPVPIPHPGVEAHENEYEDQFSKQQVDSWVADQEDDKENR